MESSNGANSVMGLDGLIRIGRQVKYFSENLFSAFPESQVAVCALTWTSNLSCGVAF